MSIESYEPAESEFPDAEEQLRSVTVSADGVRDYLQSIGDIPVLKAEQEVELAKRIEAGAYAGRLLSTDNTVQDPQLREELEWLRDDAMAAKRMFFESNLKLVVSLARRYKSPGLELLDLIQEGNLGLNHAIEKFDYKKGYKFSTYATWWIRQAIVRGKSDTERTIRLPVHMVEKVNAVHRAQRFLEQKHERPVTPEEIAADMDKDVEDVKELLKLGLDTISFDTPVDSDEESILLDFIGDRVVPPVDEAVLEHLASEELMTALSYLDERESDVIMRRYGLHNIHATPETLEAIGVRWGVTRERIRQIERDAKAKLKKIMGPHGMQLVRKTTAAIPAKSPTTPKKRANPQTRRNTVARQLETYGSRLDDGERRILSAYVLTKSIEQAARTEATGETRFRRELDAARKALDILVQLDTQGVTE